MKKFQANRKDGFTLIELLVVVSIITFLASIVIASVNVARAKSIDAKKVEEAHSVQTSMTLYHDNTNTMPGNYYHAVDGSYGSTPPGDAVAFEDTSNPNNPTTNSGKAYNRSMQDLVDAHVLPQIPHSSDPDNPYGYFDYGPGPAGAVFVTFLPTVSTSTLPTGSCHVADVSCSVPFCNPETGCSPEICTVTYPNNSHCTFTDGQTTCPSIGYCDGLATSTSSFCTCSPY